MKLFAALAALVSLASSAEWAGPIVELWSTGESADLERQLRGELKALGFDVIGESSAIDRSIQGSIAIDGPTHEVHIRVRDSEGNTRERLVPLPSKLGEGEVRVVALYVVDVLQTLFADLDRPESAPALAPSEASMPSRPTELRIWGVPSVAWGPGGLSPGMTVDLGVAWKPRLPIGPALDLAVPILALRDRVAEGSVRTWPLSIALGPALMGELWAGRLSWMLAPTFGTTAVTVRGSAQPSFEGRTGVVPTLLVQARLTLGVRLHSRVTLRIDGRVSGHWPQAVFEVLGHPRSSLGPLTIGGGIGVQIRQPLRPTKRRAAASFDSSSSTPIHRGSLTPSGEP